MLVLDEIQAFIDRLRNQKPPPITDISATWPEMDKSLREDQAKAHQGMLEAAERIGENLTNLYEIGADDPEAIDVLDQAVAVIRRKDFTDSQRVRALAILFGTGDRLR
jgi:hypothetical protein